MGIHINCRNNGDRDHMFSIIIVTWINHKQAKECIESIQNNSYYRDHEIIVFHNEHSDCDTLFGKKYYCIDLHSRNNIGLSKAANRCFVVASKDYICLIDDDITVTKNWDKHLFDAHIRMKSNWVASTRIEPIAPKWNVSTESYRRGFRPWLWYRNISNTPLLIPAKVWESIGGYDEDFPNVGAELGLAKRAYDCGIRNFLQTPLSIVSHKQSQSTKRLDNIKKARKSRDVTFKTKYGISRKDFTEIIGKGQVYKHE